MLIGGLEKFSLLDFPNHLAVIVFTVSCNFRCKFCYNKQLVVPPAVPGDDLNKGFSHVPEEDLFQFLSSRFGKLDGVVISGGEPTMHPDLPDFIRKIRSFGYAIKLDTNGTNPLMLKNLINDKLLDYVAMDIKAPQVKYEKVVNTKVDLEAIAESVKILMKNIIPYEFRTTLVPGLHVLEDIEQMGKEIAGAKLWYLQNFKSDTVLIDKNLQNKRSFSREEMLKMEEIGSKFVQNCKIRE